MLGRLRTYIRICLYVAVLTGDLDNNRTDDNRVIDTHIDEAQIDEAQIDDERFKALGNDRRRAILRLVRDEPQPAGRIAEHLGLSQPATSQHLAVLRDAGLVTVRVDGRHRWYGADHLAMSEVRAFFDGYWSSAADRLAAAAERAAQSRQAAS